MILLSVKVSHHCEYRDQKLGTAPKGFHLQVKSSKTPQETSKTKSFSRSYYSNVLNFKLSTILRIREPKVPLQEDSWLESNQSFSHGP